MKGCWYILNSACVSANKDKKTTNHEKFIVIHDILQWKYMGMHARISILLPF